VIQITDSHLLQDADGSVLGVPTRESLRRVLWNIRQDYPHSDFIIHTGDIADDAHPDSYRHLDQMVRDLNVPVVCIPGNHDDRRAMTNGLVSGMVHINRSARVGSWLIVALDTLVPNAEYGRLSDSELRRLAVDLACHTGKPALVFLHHPPVSIGSEWMDAMGLRDAQRLLDTVDAGAQVQALAWGHNHQIFETRRGGMRLLAAPATCFQFTPGSRHMELDELAPGYRVFTLYQDGAFDTEVVRVPDAWFPAQTGSA
jgi:Icc protein